MRTSSATGLESSSANVDRNAMEYGSSTYVDFFLKIGTSNNVQFWSKKFSNTAPPLAEYKLNFDAAVFPNLQCSGFGAIIRNANRKSWWECQLKGQTCTAVRKLRLWCVGKRLNSPWKQVLLGLLLKGIALSSTARQILQKTGPSLTISMMI
ncbi:hypothetical protein SO802_002583 [Lithocarpus litseifolius]|uniref:Uncharacterized protein n=1 Tax=Lithocarpus litseifolius TaxID=425828 RepID=A0AAW2DZB5_9ROSI